MKIPINTSDKYMIQSKHSSCRSHSKHKPRAAPWKLSSLHRCWLWLFLVVLKINMTNQIKIRNSTIVTTFHHLDDSHFACHCFSVSHKTISASRKKIPNKPKRINSVACKNNLLPNAHSVTVYGFPHFLHGVSCSCPLRRTMETIGAEADCSAALWKGS